MVSECARERVRGAEAEQESSNLHQSLVCVLVLIYLLT